MFKDQRRVDESHRIKAKVRTTEIAATELHSGYGFKPSLHSIKISSVDIHSNNSPRNNGVDIFWAVATC
jgi:hypothetical protein